MYTVYEGKPAISQIIYSKLDLSLSQDKIKLAFSYCKMTIIDEMNESDKYNNLKFVEFLEFIARIAEMVFEKNSQIRLYDKVYFTFQKFFALIPAQVKEPKTDVDVVSESDNDEFLN